MRQKMSKETKLFTIMFLNEVEHNLEEAIDTINYNSSQLDMCQDELDVIKASLIRLRKQFEHELSRRL